MDEQIIRREASAALDDLELDAQVTAVAQAGDNWCIQFGGDYGQFCDEFKDLFGHESSPRVVREKVKKHLLSQVTQLRNKGRRRAAKREVEASGPDASELLQEVVEQTTRVVTEAIDRSVDLASAGLKAVAETAESLNPSAAHSLAAPVREARSTPAPLASKSVGAKRVGAKRASSRHETAAKKSAGSKRASKTRTTGAGGSKKATKKAAAKKSSRRK